MTTTTAATQTPKYMVKPVDQPCGAITAHDHHALVIPYRRGAKPHRVNQPLSTMATRDQHALMRPAVAVEDCRYRMFRPREQLRAQRFPDTYQVTGNVGEQTMQAGNAVSSNVAQWLAHQLAQVL
jgi:DNA (cytosine-5)-methyltransferase 1